MARKRSYSAAGGDSGLTFSLEKLVFDDELCGQALHFCREFEVMEDLPTVDLVRQLLSEKHLLTARHTLDHWPKELYLPGTVFDRINRETWLQQGGKNLEQRAKAEVERLLNSYASPHTDPLVATEMIRIIKAGMTTAEPLPETCRRSPKRGQARPAQLRPLTVAATLTSTPVG